MFEIFIVGYEKLAFHPTTFPQPFYLNTFTFIIYLEYSQSQHAEQEIASCNLILRFIERRKVNYSFYIFIFNNIVIFTDENTVTQIIEWKKIIS